MTQVGSNVPRRTQRTPPIPMTLRGRKSYPKAGSQPISMTAGEYLTGVFGYQAKPKEAKRNAEVWQRVNELILKLKKKKQALVGYDKG